MFSDVEQYSSDWFELRAGKVTASKFGVVMATPKEYVVVSMGKEGFGIADTVAKKLPAARYQAKVQAEEALALMLDKDLSKAFGAPAKKYAVNIALEQIQGRPLELDEFVNAHMERGLEQEPIARMAYDEKYFVEVANGGFFSEGWIGVSPDGLVGDAGMVEIKSVVPSTHSANVARQSYDPAYRWQVLGQLRYTGRKWLDFVSYCADYPEGKQLYVCRLKAENFLAEFRAMDKRIALFKELVDSTKENMLSNEYFVEL